VGKESMSGSAFALTRWFDEAKDASGPEDDAIRESILNDCYEATAVAYQGEVVLVKTPKGAVMLTAENRGAAHLIWFDAVEDERWTRTRFWMNARSVSGLGEWLEKRPRASFGEIFLGAVPELPEI
jgi:hypothetical protein